MFGYFYIIILISRCHYREFDPPHEKKPTICICENKYADQLRGNCEADQRLCFRCAYKVQLLFFLNPKFPASNHLLCLCSRVCVRDVRKLHRSCFFHEAAHFIACKARKSKIKMLVHHSNHSENEQMNKIHESDCKIFLTLCKIWLPR